MKFFLPLFLLLTIDYSASAQLGSLENLDETTKKSFFKTHISSFFKDFTDFGDPFTMAGGLGINLRSYDANGGPLRQDPFFYTISGNLNFKIYQVEIPLSMVLTAKNSSSSLPSFSEFKNALSNSVDRRKKSYGRLGFSPHYKWATLHIGDRTMNLSKYTLSNLNFFGGGAEFKPGKVRFSGMYGRLAKAEPIDLSLTTPNLPVYRRVGWSTKVGYGDDKASADVVVFKAKDDESTLNIPASYLYQKSPEENLTMGVQLQKLLLERIRIKLDFTRSAVSTNTFDDLAENKTLTNFILTDRNTTYYGNAIEASLGFEGKAANFGVMLNRVDNTFNTFGAYFFNKDIMDIQSFINFGLLQNTVNSSIKVGIQSNNLDNSKPTTSKRLIYDINSAYASKDINAQVNFSNNTSTVNYILNQQLDSLNAVVVTQDAGINVSYTLPVEGENKHTISLTGNIQDVSYDIEKSSRQSVSKLYLINGQYGLSSSSKWAFTARVNFTQNKVSGMDLNRLGFGASVRKPIAKDKLNLGFNTNHFINNNGLGNSSSNTMAQFSMGSKLSSVSLQLDLGILSTTSATRPTFSEVTTNLGVNYNFSYTPSKKK